MKPPSDVSSPISSSPPPLPPDPQLESTSKEPITVTFLAKSLVSGGVAGMVAKSAVAPLDRLKILWQAQNLAYKDVGIFSGIAKITRREGFQSLFQGNGAQMIRIFPYSAIQFTAFEFYKRVFPRLLGVDEDTSHVVKFLAGSMAGVTSVLFTFPLDLIRTRLAFQNSGDKRYNGILHAWRTIHIEEGGIRGLYRGLVPSVIGMIPYSGCAFFCFEFCKNFCMIHAPAITCYEMVRQQRPSSSWGGSGGGSGSGSDHQTTVLVLRLPVKLLCGGMAGAMAQTFSYPMDVVRRRMQLAMMNPETEKFATGTFSTLRLIYKEDGLLKGVFRGLSINYIRAVPMVALSFSTYEIMKQAMNLETGKTYHK